MSLLLRGVRIVPVTSPSPADGEPVDVLIDGEQVREIGVGVSAPAGTREIDGEGRWLTPGLWDHHAHLNQWTESRGRLDTSRAGSPGELLQVVDGAVAGRNDTRPLVAWGHRAATWSDPMTGADLDAVSGAVPVILVAGDGHHAWINSAGLHALGLGSRDDVVRENDWYASYERLAELTGVVTADDMRTTLLAAAAQGVVGVVDLEFIGGPDGWQQRWTQGCDLLRVRPAVYEGRLDEALAAGWRTGVALAPGDSRLVMGPLKIISDGSLNTTTAWCCEAYAGGGVGAPNQTSEKLVELLERAHRGGLEVATHAIGDAAVAAALDAYAATGVRGSIEHAQLVRPEDVVRLAALGVRASVQPAHLLDDRDPTEHLWPGRGGRCFPFRSMVEAGVDLRLGSDAPVSPLDPWLAIAAAVHRSADERPAWHPEQALDAREALAASTDGQGTVAVGSRADLALLDRDPLAAADSPRVAAAALRATTSALTVVAGRVVHEDA